MRPRGTDLDETKVIFLVPDAIYIISYRYFKQPSSPLPHSHYNDDECHNGCRGDEQRVDKNTVIIFKTIIVNSLQSQLCKMYTIYMNFKTFSDINDLYVCK